MKHPEGWAREFSRTWQGIEDFWKGSSGWNVLGRSGSCGGESHVGIMGNKSLCCMKNCPPLPESDQRGFWLDCSSECQKGRLILPVTWNYPVPRAKKLQPTLSSFQPHMLELFLFTPLCLLPFLHLPLHIPPRKAHFWMDRMEGKRRGLWNEGTGALSYPWRVGTPFHSQALRLYSQGQELMAKPSSWKPKERELWVGESFCSQNLDLPCKFRDVYQYYKSDFEYWKGSRKETLLIYQMYCLCMYVCVLWMWFYLQRIKVYRKRWEPMD